MPIGGSVMFRDPASHAVVIVKTKHVKTYSGRLASYASAYPPSHGYFVKIPVKLTDVGPGTWRIDRTWFVLHAGGLRLTMDDGNGPFSGASNVLGSTFLDPGQSDASSIVIDSPSTHGELSYEPKHKLACTWTF